MSLNPNTLNKNPQFVKSDSKKNILVNKSAITLKENLDKNDMQELKRQAKEKQRLMEKRKKAAIKIQALWKGYRSRIKFKKIK